MPPICTFPSIKTLNFQHPVNIIISGSTGTGKSTFCRNLLEFKAIDGDIKQIHYFMRRSEQIDFNLPKDVEFYTHEGLPDKDWHNRTFKNKRKDVLIIVDDQWGEAVNDELCNDLIFYGRSHDFISIIFITQNYFAKGKHSIFMK